MSVTLDFENSLWAMADKLRGNIQPSDYKDIVLGLIFLKYISDGFEAKFQELMDEGEGNEEDRDEYEAECIFFVPKSAHCLQKAILNTIKIGISTARVEANNNKNKLIIRRGFGYRNIQNLIDMILLCCSKISIPLPNRSGTKLKAA